MRTVSQRWLDNQLEDAACPSRMHGWLDTYTKGALITPIVSAPNALAHPNGDGTLGVAFRVPEDDYTVEQVQFSLALDSWSTGAVLDAVIWSYDPAANTLIDVVGAAQYLIDGDFAAKECAFDAFDINGTPIDPLVLDTGDYVALLVAPPSGTLRMYYGAGTQSDFLISTIARDVSASIIREYGALPYFGLVGHRADMNRDHHWSMSSDPAIDNIIDAAVTSTFDITCNTFPSEDCAVTVQNGVYGDSEGVATYDFTTTENKAALKNSGQIGVQLGYTYNDGAFDSLAITTQRLDNAVLSDDQLSLTVKGTSFALKMDTETFYGGLYRPNGISAYSLFQQLCEDMFSEPKQGWRYRLGSAGCKVGSGSLWVRGGGGWRYRLGQSDCVVGAGSLWRPDASQYYVIDPALKTVYVTLPIPPMTYREAFIRLAAYTGAYLRHDSAGTLVITASLGSVLDYTLDIDRVYDVPKTTIPDPIGVISGKLRAYSVGDELATTTVDISVVSRRTQQFRVTHDAYDSATLTLVGAALVSTPLYGTYSTTFLATPTEDVVSATVSGYPVDFTESVMSRQYGDGNTVDVDNPLASDPAMTLAMFDHYQKYATATKYEFSMRDDPAVETGDRVTLETLAGGVPVVVTDIKRAYNGGIDGTYTVVADPEA